MTSPVEGGLACHFIAAPGAPDAPLVTPPRGTGTTRAVVDLAGHDVQSEARLVAPHRQDAGRPAHVRRDVVFVHAPSGETAPLPGGREVAPVAGDGPSADTPPAHDPERVVAHEVRAPAIQAERRP